jgi:hypothetical protein
MPSPLRAITRSLALRSIPLLAAFVLLASRASAQAVSDADRAAARELFVEGVKLQEAGSFADALDRFQRAQAVFSAPTHLLHIAECDAALGKLVESAEMYRTLVRTPLPAGAPNAFVQAQQQAAAELPQVEPRIPSVRLVVKPDRVTGLSILIDGQPTSTALVGVQRPIDPGTHTVTVTASGYAKNEQHVTLREKENKDLAITLSPVSGITYAQPQLPPAAPAAPQTYSPPPLSGPAAPPPPVYMTSPEEQEAERRQPGGGFMLGATLGVVIPAGALYQGQSLSQLTGPGPSVGLDAGFRFVKRLYIGVVLSHGFLGTGSASSNPATGESLTATANTNYAGVNLAYISNPRGVAFFGEIGAGYRALSTDVVSTRNGDTSSQYSGAEVSLGAGMHFKLGDWVRLVPELSFTAGQFSAVNCTGPSTGSSPITACPSPGDLSRPDTHSFVLLGVTAFVDFARKH